MNKLAAFLLGLMVFASTPASAQSGRELYDRGLFQQAYEIMRPAVEGNELDAVFLTLVIRRNGLDGQMAANADEIAALWATLVLGKKTMEEGLRNLDLGQDIKDVYRTALAQIDYFGEIHPSWPPGPSRPEQINRARSASRLVAEAVDRFTPATNFTAYLSLEPAISRASRAFDFTLDAAERGDYLAMGNLAWMYREGVGTSKNNLRAAHWAREGSESVPPSARAENEVGYVYETGRGVTRDKSEALKWYERAAAKAHQAAVMNVHRLKYKGPGDPIMDNQILF